MNDPYVFLALIYQKDGDEAIQDIFEDCVVSIELRRPGCFDVWDGDQTGSGRGRMTMVFISTSLDWFEGHSRMFDRMRRG